MAPFARSHLWGICTAVSVGSQCVVTRFARRHLWGTCAAVSVGSQCVVARFARRHLTVSVRPSVLGHSTCWLASLVGSYDVFVPRSVSGHSP